MSVTCRVVFRLMRRFASTPVRPAKRGWTAAVAAILLPAIACFPVAAAAHSGAVAILPAVAIVPTNAPNACCAQNAAPLPTAMRPYTFKVAASAPSGAVSARAVLRDTRFILARGVAVEKGLQVKTVLVARAISAKFPEIRSIGGVRPDGLKWHPNGLALDVMIPDYRSPGGKALADRIAAYALANADRFGLNHVIWRQVLYLPNGTVRRMGDHGSDDANHFTHVHIATNGGGFPTGRETYFTSIGGGPAISVR
jgi:hypothetical protein